MSHAVHRALESMALLARADQKQVRAAADAGRILVASWGRFRPFEMALPFAPAPPEKIGGDSRALRVRGQCWTRTALNNWRAVD